MVNKNKFFYILEIIRIRFNNILAIISFNILKLFFPKKQNDERQTNNILFINTGLLGDVIISTIIFANDKELSSLYEKVYFLVNKKYEEIFEEYNDNINIIFWDSKKYKFNLFYRIDFLRKLNRLNLNRSINITFARRIIDDEISLLNGAKEKLCFENNPKIVKSFSKYIDTYYDMVMAPIFSNHFDNLIDLIKGFGITKPEFATNVFFKKKAPLIYNYRIERNFNNKIFSIAPFSSNPVKDWDFKKYIQLISLLIEEYNPLILILGDKIKNNKMKKAFLLGPKIIDTTGLTTLSEVTFLISVSDLFVGNDSGLFHLAKTYNKKRVGIVGGGALNITLPYNNYENEILLYKEMECFQCHWNCKFNLSYCVQDVSVHEVFNSIKKLLNDE